MRISAKAIKEYMDIDSEFIQGVSPDELDSRMEGSKLDMTLESVYEMPISCCGAFVGVNNRRTPNAIEIPPTKFPKSQRLQDGLVGWVLRDGYYLLRTNETIKLPDWMCATVHERTTMFKSRGIVSCTTVDPGFNGKIVAGLYVPSSLELALEVDARILSVSFEPVVELHFKSSNQPVSVISLSCSNNNSYTGIWGGDKVCTNGIERGF